MSPKLEEPVQLYGRLHESPANQRDVHFDWLKQFCEKEAAATGLARREVFGFGQRKFFERLQTEAKRVGRPP